MSSKNYLVKPTAIVHSSNEMSAVERKILNVLLKARANIQSAANHTILMSELIEQLGHEHYSNQKFLKESLLGLLDNSMRLNLIGKDKRVKIESAIAIFSHITIIEGRVIYSFSQEIVKIMTMQTIYAYLNLDIQQLMSSKYSVALWEFCSEQLDSARKEFVETQDIKVEDLKILLGAENALYNDFKYFKRDILIKATKEINKISDLMVEVVYLREQRKITKVRFIIRRKSVVNEERQIQIPYLEENILELIETTVGRQELIYDASSVGIDQKDLDKFLQKYSSEEVKNVIKHIQKKIDQKYQFSNVIGYIWKLLENGLVEEMDQVDKFTKQLDLMEEKVFTDIKNECEKEFFLELRRHFGDAVYKSWMLHLTIVSKEEKKVTFALPNGFIRDWMEQHYKKGISLIWKKGHPETEEIIMIVVKRC